MRAALPMPWSNGQAEGLPPRQMNNVRPVSFDPPASSRTKSDQLQLPRHQTCAEVVVRPLIRLLFNVYLFVVLLGALINC